MQNLPDVTSLLSFPLKVFDKLTGATSEMDKLATRIALGAIAVSTFGSWLYLRHVRHAAEPPKDVRSASTSTPKLFRSVNSAVTWRATDAIGINMGPPGSRASSADWLVEVQNHVHQMFGGVLGKGYALPEETLTVSMAHQGFRVGAGCQHFVPTFEAPDGWRPSYRLISPRVQLTYLCTPEGKSYLAGVCFYLRPAWHVWPETSAAEQMATFRAAVQRVRTWSARCDVASVRREKRVYRAVCAEIQKPVWIVDSGRGKFFKFAFEDRLQVFRMVECSCF